MKVRTILGAALLLTGITVLGVGHISIIERIIGAILVLAGLDLRYQERR